jgi:hypothetical protein
MAYDVLINLSRPRVSLINFVCLLFATNFTFPTRYSQVNLHLLLFIVM